MTDEPTFDVVLMLEDVHDIVDALDVAIEERAEYHNFLLKNPALDDYSESDRDAIEAQEERWEGIKKMLLDETNR